MAPRDGAESVDPSTGWGAARGTWVTKSSTMKSSEEYPDQLARAIAKAVNEAWKNPSAKYGDGGGSESD